MVALHRTFSVAPRVSQPASLSISLELPHHVAPETVNSLLARKRHQLDVARLSRLKAHRRPGRNIEPHAAGFFAIEFQRGVGFKEMVVRTNLDRTVPGVRNCQRDRLSAGIELDLAVLDEPFTGDHVIS